MELFSIKGLKAGPTFLFHDQAPFAEVLNAVEDELVRAKGFFRDSPVVLHFGNRLLHKEEWRKLKELLLAEGLLLRYAVATAQVSRELLYKEGLPVRDSLSVSTSEQKPQQAALTKGTNTLYLRRGLRGGQKEVFEGDVVVMGDVNQGAEILAGGDVVVVGTLRGMVHAGYPDNKEAVVVALNLTPLQLRIGPQIARGDDNQNNRRAPRPEIARVKDENIMIEPYQGKP
ncbi:MAG: septum site-determining protein MinC [Candidatus Binatia bacterium]